jgi:hypothetical protein
VAQAAVISTAYATTRISAPITAAAFHTRQTLDSTDLRHWTAGNAFMTLYHPMEGLSLSPRFCSSTVRKHPLPKTRTTSLGARGGRTWRIPPWHFVQIRQHAFQTRSSKAFRGHQSHFAAAQPPRRSEHPYSHTAYPHGASVVHESNQDPYASGRSRYEDSHGRPFDNNVVVPPFAPDPPYGDASSFRLSSGRDGYT